MFYDRFIELCKANNEKPTPLVVKMGLSSSNVAQWKKGSTPRPAVLKQIADHFNVPVSSLLDFMDEKKPASGEAGGLSEGVMELIGLYDQGSPEYQAELLGYARGLAAARKSLGIEKEGK